MQEKVCCMGLIIMRPKPRSPTTMILTYDSEPLLGSRRGWTQCGFQTPKIVISVGLIQRNSGAFAYKKIPNTHVTKILL